MTMRPPPPTSTLFPYTTYILAVTEPLRPDTYVPAHMAFILATAQAARQFDYDILLLTQEEAVEGLERVTNSRIVDGIIVLRSEEHTSELQSRGHLVCRL